MDLGVAAPSSTLPDPDPDFAAPGVLWAARNWIFEPQMRARLEDPDPCFAAPDPN